jgi:Putative auto-transporter adhesin, head GIN domain
MVSICRVLLVVFLFTANLNGLFAQFKGNGNVTTEAREVKYFDEIVAKGQFDLLITQGKEYKVEVTVDENLQNYILTQVTKQKLYIEVPDNIRKMKELKIHLTVDDLNSFVLLGEVDAITDTLHLRTADFFVSGTSDLELNIVSETLDFEVTDVANVTINGSADEFNLRVTDEAFLDAKHLETNICTLKASGFSDISVNVQKKFNLRVTGIGKIYYYGTPEINNMINSGTTFIIRRKLAE